MTDASTEDFFPTPSEAHWEAAAFEYLGKGRRLGVWARFFAQTGGDETLTQAAYLHHRAHEIALDEYRVHLAEALRNREAEIQREAAKRREAAEQAAAKRAFEAGVKGRCPNCRSIILLQAQACDKCNAIFEEGSVWRVQPL